MKSLTLSLLVLVFATAYLKSQDLLIHKTDGTVITIPLIAIDSITFVQGPGNLVCGNYSVTDADGNVYNTVQIGNQCWMKENMKVGTMITGYQNQSNDGIIEKYCYDDNPSYCDTYGGLYQWDEAMQYLTTPGAQGICPPGWHIPTDAEWTVLTDYLFGESVAGGKMKTTGVIEDGTGLWYAPNTGATNSSGFSGLPAGFRGTNGNFGILGHLGYLWSSTEGNANEAWDRILARYDAIAGRYNDDKDFGFSARCVRD